MRDFFRYDDSARVKEVVFERAKSRGKQNGFTAAPCFVIYLI